MHYLHQKNDKLVISSSFFSIFAEETRGIYSPRKIFLSVQIERTI